MIRRIHWEEKIHTYVSAFDEIRKRTIQWDVTWDGATRAETGGRTFYDMDESFAHIGELQPSDNYRLEGSIDSGHFTMRFDV